MNRYPIALLCLTGLLCHFPVTNSTQPMSPPDMPLSQMARWGVYRLEGLGGDAKLQALIQLLCREIGQQTEHGIRLSIRLTHLQLSEMIGTTRMTITRLIQNFRKEGWLSIDRTRRLVVRDL